MAIHTSQHHPPGGSAAPQATKRSAAPEKPEVKEAGQPLKASAASAGEDLKQKGAEVLSDQKNRAANELSTLGAAIRSAADKLREDDEGTVAGYAEMAAQRLEGAARFIGERDVPSMVREVERVVRRRPELFLCGMFVAGLGISRFLIASRSSDGEFRRQ